MDFSHSDIVRGVIAAANYELGLSVRSVGSEDRITEYFDAANWRWALNEAGVERYSEAARRRRPSILNWCGIGAAWIYRQAPLFMEPMECGHEKPRIKQGIVDHVLPSTWRLKTADNWISAGAPPARPLKPERIRAGDIVTVVTGSGKRYGDHIVIALDSPRDGLFPAVESNASGLGEPFDNGNPWDGLVVGDNPHRGFVRRLRSVDDVRRVYRLKLDDHFSDVVV